MRKISQPSAEAMKMFKDVGMSSIAVHQVTPEERSALEAALRKIPDALLRAAATSIDSLNFVDGLAGIGTGLTRPTTDTDRPPRFEVTLRSDIFTDTLSAMLIRKERQNLKGEDASRLTVLANPQPALRYVLTHEFAHVWEHALVPSQVEDFRSGVWKDWRTLAGGLASSPVSKSAYRRHPPQHVRELVASYDDLVKSPFVSLYATASSHEDLAETTAWAVLMADGQTPMQIVLSGERPRKYSPLSNVVARKRMDLISTFL